MRKLLTRAKNFFLDHINWCHPTLSNGEEKPDGWFNDMWNYTIWPIPWMEKPCWCCASVRGSANGGWACALLAYIFGPLPVLIALTVVQIVIWLGVLYWRIDNVAS